MNNNPIMISTQQIKELREKTGASISDIKKVLEESRGDMGKAFTEIERKLGSSAGRRASRETAAGVVDGYIHSNARIGALMELFCETDFVARNHEFKALAHDIAMHIAAMDPSDTAALLIEPFIKDPGKTIGDLVNEAGGRFGENIKVGKFVRFEL